jgi:hypothetical protein
MFPKVPILASAMVVLDAISICNAFGIHIWEFLMESSDAEAFVRFAHGIFEQAKTGDAELVFKMKEKLERLNPALRIKVDSDGQPIDSGNARSQRISNTDWYEHRGQHQPSHQIARKPGGLVLPHDLQSR